MTKILSHLSRKGDPRIGKRGKFNPTALFRYYDRQAADAADNLRRLVERTFSNNVEAVKEQIRERFEDIPYPDADEDATLRQEIECLKAITKFYNEVANEIEAGVFEPPQTEPTTIFEMAYQTIKAKQQWTAGETVTLWSGKTYTVYITEAGQDGGGELYLGVSGKLSKKVEVVIGHLNPVSGWKFTLSPQYYNAWVLKVKRAYRMTSGWQPDVTMDFGKGDVNQFREGRLSPEYRKRAMRARSLR